MIEANRYENVVIFWKSRVAIDLHEQSRFIVHRAFTNSITQQFDFILVCIKTRVMGCSCIKMTYSVVQSRHFYWGMRMPLRCRKIDTNNGGIRVLWTTCRGQNLGPSAKNLVDIYTKLAVWFITVVRHTYRVMYFASPSQNHKNLENLSRTTPGDQNLLLERQLPVQTSVQALNTLRGYVQRK